MTSKKGASFAGFLFLTLTAAGNYGCGGGSPPPPPPIFVTVTSSAQSVDQSRSVSLTAGVNNDTANKGVIWSLSGSGCTGDGCGTLSNKTATSAAYTAPSTVTASLSVQVVATSVADATKLATASLTVVPPPSVTTASLPGGTGGLMMADGKGGVTFNTDSSNGGTIAQNQTFTAAYSVLNAGRVTVTGSQTSPRWILYLADKNQGFLLDTGGNVGFGFVEPQGAAPTGGFANSSLSGSFSAGTIAPSVTPSVSAAGLATLDGAGSFSESATLSNTSGLFVNDKTTGTYSVSTNGRGTVTRLVISLAGIGGSLTSLLLFLSLLLGRLITRRNPSRRSLALFGAAVLIAPMLAGCTLPTNQFVFYMVSPTKAVMMHQALSDTAPGITIIGQ